MEIDRRTWMRVAGAVGLLRAIDIELDAQQPPPSPSQVVDQAMLHEALRILGLEFTPEQEKMMLTGVNRNLQSYGALRQLSIPLDTDPAIRFDPRLPGVHYPTGSSAFQLSEHATTRKQRSWKSVEDLAFSPVTELAPLLRTRQVSSLDLTRMYLERLKKYGPKLNCVITLTEDLAIEQAKKADAEIRAGRHRGLLHGIPWGAKDLFATKDIPTTWGAEPYREQVFSYDSAVVQRLEKAGAVLLAKLSMGALAQGGLWFGGMTKTPWNIERTSSGSSAGSASATAAGLVGFAMGTETLGSIVSPSVACGVVGLRPTFGRVSRHGAMALSWTMDKIGPICRSVEDTAIVLRAVMGPDGLDQTVVEAPFDWKPHTAVTTLRVGYLNAEFEKRTDESKPVYDQALETLRKLGVELQPVSLPGLEAGPLRTILVSEAAAAFDDLTRDGGVNQLKGQEASDWPNTFRTSRLIPAVEYIRAQRARTLLMRQMHELMSKWDVIVCTPGPSLTATNLTGHPQVVVPCGFVKDRPLGLVFTGRLYEEGLPLRLAFAFERATEWHTMHPKMDWV